MTHNYRIAGINIAITTATETYFKNNLDAYKISSEIPVTHTLKTLITDDLSVPEGTIIATHKNRETRLTNTHEITIAYDTNDQVKTIIACRLDFKEVTISLVKHRHKNLDEQEYLLTGMFFLEMALLEGKLAIHASAIEYNNHALLFSANSGVGKTTHRKYWQENFNVRIINDDKPLLYKQRNQWVVSGTPWSGKETINTNITVPLKAIIFIEQSHSNKVYQTPQKDRLKRVMNHTLRPRNHILLEPSIALMDDLIQTAPMYHAHLTHSAQSVQPIYDILFKGEPHVKD